MPASRIWPETGKGGGAHTSGEEAGAGGCRSGEGQAGAGAPAPFGGWGDGRRTSAARVDRGGGETGWTYKEYLHARRLTTSPEH